MRLNTFAYLQGDHMRLLPVWNLGHRLFYSGLPGGRRLGVAIQRWIRMRWGCDLPVALQLPDDVVFMHDALGVVVHPRTTFAGAAIIYQNTTLGMAHRRGSGTPRIGANVLIGAGAQVLGSVQIGDASIIGANSVVTEDVPPASMVSQAGVRPIDPERVLQYFQPR